LQTFKKAFYDKALPHFCRYYADTVYPQAKPAIREKNLDLIAQFV